MLTKKYLNELTYEIIGSAIEVHKVMGKGLLESVYHQCLKKSYCIGK
jgi:GxxExxY protein